ncbi:winged helix-turn-helix domain-containing protein [Arcobacter arenosus]|jgi:DNA-binding response OmpR family regulator|uniref:Response regulator transcription factor n=1 Tax=Arcobacter arenosus TaxID=2576037 RepID=A0A5R8XZZ8_9BACT|nr:winged helix-turn-helix domain-containing protein [Arcobacter arenosus]TLP37819.1 response regulator transcription factor [Arcobacter arenosus]
MRLLSYNIDEKIIEHLEENNLYIIDVAEDMDDAIYHSKVRYYNMILVNSSNYYDCKDILDNINCRFTAVIFICDEPSKEFQLDLLKNGAMDILQSPVSTKYLLTKIESIHRENFQENILYKDKFIVNMKDEQLFDDNENVVNLKGKSFSILAYLLKNRHRGSISKDELLQTNWEEPEMVSDNVIEVNINLIRNALKKEFDDNFIETIRHRGYKIVS